MSEIRDFHACSQFDKVYPPDPDFYCECGKSWRQWNGEQNLLRIDREAEQDGEYVSYVDAADALSAFLDVLAGIRTINEAMHGLGFETRGSGDIFNRLATGEILPVP